MPQSRFLARALSYYQAPNNRFESDLVKRCALSSAPQASR